MKTTKTLLACILALALLPVFTTAAYAADGSQGDPYIGGEAFGKGENSIVVHKYDVTSFEKKKAKELGVDSVKYTPNADKPTGEALVPGSIIGTYVTSADLSTPIDVTLAEMNQLGNITFQIEQVELNTSANPKPDPGSSNVGDYVTKTGGISSYAKTDAQGEISWTELEAGYYRITEPPNDTSTHEIAVSFIVAVPMVNPADTTNTLEAVHVYPKNITNAGPVIEKEKPAINDFNGNVVPWKIKAEIPKALKKVKGSQVYTITDTMSLGLLYKGNAKVYYLKSSDGTEQVLTAGTDYALTATPGGSSLVVNLLDAGFTTLGTALENSEIGVDPAGKFILYVTYDTVMNLSEEQFESGITFENEVKLDFTNSDGNVYQDTPPEVEVDEFGALRIYKKDGSDQSILLPGAEFKLYTDASLAETSVLKDASGTAITFVTDANGEFFYGGLAAGEYYLVETKAPSDKYKMLTGSTKIVIEEKEITKGEILNYRDNSFSLPETGGMGIAIFVTVGVLLLVSAGIIFVTARKQSKNKTEQ